MYIFRAPQNKGAPMSGHSSVSNLNLRRKLSAKADCSSSALPNHPSLNESPLLRLNEKQLAHRWNISVRTLQAARVKGNGVQFIRIGRAVRYRMEDVLAYEEAQLRTSTSEAQ